MSSCINSIVRPIVSANVYFLRDILSAFEKLIVALFGLTHSYLPGPGWSFAYDYVVNLFSLPTFTPIFSLLGWTWYAPGPGKLIVLLSSKDWWPKETEVVSFVSCTIYAPGPGTPLIFYLPLFSCPIIPILLFLQALGGLYVLGAGFLL